jgi:hypothetical protein
MKCRSALFALFYLCARASALDPSVQAGTSAKPRAYVSFGDHGYISISPDGHWLAYLITAMANRFECWLENHVRGHTLDTELQVTPEGRAENHPKVAEAHSRQPRGQRLMLVYPAKHRLLLLLASGCRPEDLHCIGRGGGGCAGCR